MVSRADDFQQAFRNLQLQPLITAEDTRKFHVPYAEDLLPELEQVIRDCTNLNNQLIFAGHRGCGKSTLLARFFERIKDDFFAVFFSISDLIEMSEVNHITILFAIALRLMEEATKQQIEIPEDKIESFFNWFKKHTYEEVNRLGAELETGFDLFGILKGGLKTDATVRESITTEFRKNFRELVDTINLMAIEIKLACRKEIVVIIDDIDKLDLSKIKEVFEGNIKALLEPRFFVIYTIPIATIRDGGLKKHIEDETGNPIFLMPVQKLFNQRSQTQEDPVQPIEATVETLRQVLFKRVKPELMAEGIADQIVLQSGGVLREVIRVAQECCRLVRVEILKKQRRQESVEVDQIDDQVLRQALDNVRNGMAITLSKTDREILTTVYEKGIPEDPKQQDFLDLLHTIYVIEYRNGHSWYDLHPLIVKQLRQEGVL